MTLCGIYSLDYRVSRNRGTRFIVTRAVLVVVVGWPVRGVPFYGSCWVVLVYLGAHLAACAHFVGTPLGCLV